MLMCAVLPVQNASLERILIQMKPEAAQVREMAGGADTCI